MIFMIIWTSRAYVSFINAHQPTVTITVIIGRDKSGQTRCTVHRTFYKLDIHIYVYISFTAYAY